MPVALGDAMLPFARARVVVASWLSLTTLAAPWLALAGACGGGDAVTSPQLPSDAGTAAPDGATDGDVEAKGASRVVAPSDASAGTDTGADGGDLLAFETFMVGDQGAIVTTGTIGGAASNGLRIVIGSGGYFCGGTGLAGASSIELDLATTAASLTPGTYAITNGTGGTTRSEAVFQRIDPQCRSLASHPALSGSITIASVGAGSVTGNYDVVFAGFGSLGRALGGFTAPLCNAAAWGPHANCLP